MASKSNPVTPSTMKHPLTMDQYTYDMLSANQHVLRYVEDVLSSSSLTVKEKGKFETLKSQLKECSTADGTYFIKFKDIQMLHKALKRSKKMEDGETETELFLCDVMFNCNCEPLLPKAPIPERSQEYDARMEKLRRKAADQEYKRMTKNVASGSDYNEDSIGKELRNMDSQVMSIINFLLTVVGAFVFAYKAVEYSLPVPNLSFQLTAGVCLATLVFFADVYFIVKDYGKE